MTLCVFRMMCDGRRVGRRPTTGDEMAEHSTGPHPRPGALVLTAPPQEVLGTADPSVLTPDERRRHAAWRPPAYRNAFLDSLLLVRLCAGALRGWPVGPLEVVELAATGGNWGLGRP